MTICPEIPTLASFSRLNRIANTWEPQAHFRPHNKRKRKEKRQSNTNAHTLSLSLSIALQQLLANTQQRESLDGARNRHLNLFNFIIFSFIQHQKQKRRFRRSGGEEDGRRRHRRRRVQRYGSCCEYHRWRAVFSSAGRFSFRF